MYFFLTKIVLQPYVALLIALGLATIVPCWRRRRTPEGRRLRLVLVALWAALWCVSTPLFAFGAAWTIERAFPLRDTRPEEVAAIVVLAGGVVRADSVLPSPRLTEDSIDRCLHAARLYHAGPPCLVVVTGGQLDPGGKIPPVAPIMRDFLVELGVPAERIVVEPRAQTTRDSAREVRAILRERPAGPGPVLLVTEASHMERSLRTFRKQGLVCDPAASSRIATELEPAASLFLPSPRALRDVHVVCHEWFGLAWYWLSGKT